MTEKKTQPEATTETATKTSTEPEAPREIEHDNPAPEETGGSEIKNPFEEMAKEPEVPEVDPLAKEIETLKETVENLSTHLKPEFKTPENLDEEEQEKSTSLEVDRRRG